MQRALTAALAAITVTAAAAVMPVAAARADIYARVLATYEATGSIPPCDFSSAQLASALKGIDTYGEEYFADFSNAVENALSARASGVCAPGARRALSVGSSARLHAAALPGSVTSPTNADLPAPILLMAALAILFAAVAAAAALARARGWDPAWAAGWRHAWGEASYRVEGRWAEVLDWLRSGRE